MGMKWTEEQKKVIDLRNRNILVSAAAGSGKTATLVERIIQRITEGEKPIDVDQLLVVTFTKAAAAEMRERIGDAIEKKRMESPRNRHLQRQSLLLHSAQITTIDSFCLSVLQNYFHEIDLDPVFRVAEEEELKLLQQDVILELLEEKYEEGEESFLAFSGNYGGKHQDTRLEEYILKLYRFSESCAWPDKWLENQLQEQEKSLAEMVWMERVLTLTEETLENCEYLTLKAIQLCQEENGPYNYKAALESDLQLLDRLRHNKDYQAAVKAFSEISYTALSRKSMPDCSEEKKELVKAMRDQVKGAIALLVKNYYFQEYEEMEADWEGAKEPTRVLLQLTLEFRKKYAARKADRKVLDFSDVEHFALNILAEQREDGVHARPAALELRRQYEEIMIDEYQDSNEVQDMILTSISREAEGEPNLFMVGDVKQSIYRFRMAKPELFLQKYNSYTKEESRFQRIDLHQNFRSRAQVLEGVNELFYCIMGRKFGGIEYDDDAALYPGADYCLREQEAIGNQVELVLVEKGSAEEQDAAEEQEITEEQEEYSAKEQEALQCAVMIQKLVQDGFRVQGRNEEGNPELRPCSYGDIVILLRSMSGWSEVFSQIFLEQGIPVSTTTQSGYFAAPEIKWLLNYLRSLDNPRQDIPFTGVLSSPFVGLLPEELANLRTENERRQSMYECALQYEKQGSKKQIRQKLSDFLILFQKLRRRARILSVPELLMELYDLTGYDSYILAMADGAHRMQNLTMFSAKAAAFEKSNYRGLFQFIRYVERLNRYEIDYGEAAGGGAEENAVRIMSIHKSKGLEFPVVFLCGVAKRFNMQDIRASAVFHPEYGVGLDCIDDTLRTTIPTLKKKMLQSLLLEEAVAEEERLLYVGMTRAKEKLYLTAYVKNRASEEKKWEARAGLHGRLSSTVLRQAASYLDFIGPALTAVHTFSIQYVTGAALSENREQLKTERRAQRQEFLRPKREELTTDRAVLQQIREYVSFVYPFEAERSLPLKTSVSEIKKHFFAEDEFEAAHLIRETVMEGGKAGEVSGDGDLMEKTEQTGRMPEFLKGQTAVKGTDRGTLYHRVLELMSVKAGKTNAEISEELEKLTAAGRISPEECKLLSVPKLTAFYATSLAVRMERAALQERLYQEQPFVLAIPAGELYDGNSKEPVLIQGIIDVFFEEEDGLVLLDYKTDSVQQDPEQTLRRRYTKQLELYREALEKITGKKVKEKLIYSFYLQKELSL